jgi:hypothetical protein
MEAALAAGATVVWCLSDPKRMNFFGYRETHLGYAAPKVAAVVKRSGLLEKKGRRMGAIDPDSPFTCYFDVLSRTGWTFCLSDPADGITSIASTPEGYTLKNGCSKTPIQGLGNSWMCGTERDIHFGEGLPS